MKNYRIEEKVSGGTTGKWRTAKALGAIDLQEAIETLRLLDVATPAAFGRRLRFTRTATKRSMTAPEYMSELINYGGTFVPRGYAYQKLINLAVAQGHDKPNLMADRWMQGYDVRQRVQNSPSLGTKGE